MAEYDRGKALATCRSKRWYETLPAAEAAGVDLGRFFETTFYAYECAMCGLFHLSRSAPDPKRTEALKRMEAQYRAQLRRQYGGN
jgi:hypothetical protein